MSAYFPIQRLTRLRASKALRALTQENVLSTQDLIIPLFIIHGENLEKPIQAMPGQFQYSIDRLIIKAQDLFQAGVLAVLLFGLPKHKDSLGSESYSEQGLVQRAIRALKQAVPELLVITDVCLCSYTDTGHCGVIHPHTGLLDNDASCEIFAKIAVSHAKAGADLVAPSGMADGMIKFMRTALDHNNFNSIGLLSYAVKYASSFYGPFREVADSAPQKTTASGLSLKIHDRQTYQLNPANSREALLEAELDAQEGADILMVKPALAYLDIIYQLKNKFNQPICAYQVSGEYSMVKAAAEKNWIDGPAVLFESLLAIKRAGADLIITYAFEDIKKFLS